MAKIYRIPLGYRILRIYSNNFFRHWFTSVEVNGRENIPEDASVIFAPNHQNAFVDAMALLSSSPEPVIFLARADLFRKKWSNKILRWLKIMPAYRMRDGIQNLKKNADSFNDAVKVLMHKEYFCLMPEGGQVERRKLRPLVKGMFRIGFSAQTEYGDSDSVWIVPTGFDYGNYDHSGGHLVVNFGKPINMHDYYKLYQESVPVAQNKIRDDLYDRMAPLMLNIRTDEHYDAFYIAAYLYAYDQVFNLGWDDNETNRLIARQQIVLALDKAAASGKFEAELKKLDEDTAKWHENHSNIELSAVSREYGTSFDGSLVQSIIHEVVMALPAIYGIIINSPVIAFIKWGNNKWGAQGFYGTVAMAASMFFFPFWHLAIMIAGGLFLWHTLGWLVAVLFIVTTPMSVFFLLRYRWNTKFLYHRLKDVFCKENLADEICDQIKHFMEEAKTLPELNEKIHYSSDRKVEEADNESNAKDE